MSAGIEHIGIVGTGRMGPELFDFVEGTGFRATLLGRRADAAEEHRLRFLKALDFAREEGILDEEEFLLRKERASFTTRLEDLHDCDLVIEAIHESATRKKSLFADLDAAVQESCLFASCSSSIVPSEYAPGTARAGRTFGLHFFYPPKMVGIVEIVRSEVSDKGEQQRLVSFLGDLDRTHLLETEDEPFVINRAVLPLQAQAYRFVEDGRASFAQMDALLRERFHLPAGVFEMFDQVGIDVMYPSVARYAARQKDIASFVAPLEKGLARLFEARRLGRKSGAGFFDYDEGRRREDGDGAPLPADAAEEMYDRMRLLLFNQVYYFVGRNVALASDLFSSVGEAYGFDVRLEQWMGGYALRDIGAELETIHQVTGEEAFRPRGCLLDCAAEEDGTDHEGGDHGSDTPDGDDEVA